MPSWTRFTGQVADSPHGADHEPSVNLPPPPPWRRFDKAHRGTTMRPTPQAIEMVNIALYLRRPLLITGKPGTGKSSLAFAVAQEIGLGEVLHWPINTRSVLQDGLYRYDALARLRDSQVQKAHIANGSSDQHEQKSDALSIAQDIANYIRLGPLGTALLPTNCPRVLLIDEIDKSDIDLPNDLLNVFEEGEFFIPELAPQRLDIKAFDEDLAITTHLTSHDNRPVAVTNGLVQCHEFPLVIMTSNGERDFPPAFLRRCLRLHIEPPTSLELADIVRAHVGEEIFNAFEGRLTAEIAHFVDNRDKQKDDLATDQLLNVIYLLTQDINLTDEAKKVVLQKLNAGM
jgi:MoxR-like ATPase